MSRPHHFKLQLSYAANKIPDITRDFFFKVLKRHVRERKFSARLLNFFAQEIAFRERHPEFSVPLQRLEV